MGATCGFGHRWLLTVQAMRWQNAGLIFYHRGESSCNMKSKHSEGFKSGLWADLKASSVRTKGWRSHVTHFHATPAARGRQRMHLLPQTVVLCFTSGDPVNCWGLHMGVCTTACCFTSSTLLLVFFYIITEQHCWHVTANEHNFIIGVFYNVSREPSALP